MKQPSCQPTQVGRGSRCSSCVRSPKLINVTGQRHHARPSCDGTDWRAFGLRVPSADRLRRRPVSAFSPPDGSVCGVAHCRRPTGNGEDAFQDLVIPGLSWSSECLCPLLIGRGGGQTRACPPRFKDMGLGSCKKCELLLTLRGLSEDRHFPPTNRACNRRIIRQWRGTARCLQAAG